MYKKDLFQLTIKRGLHFIATLNALQKLEPVYRQSDIVDKKRAPRLLVKNFISKGINEKSDNVAKLDCVPKQRLQSVEVLPYRTIIEKRSHGDNLAKSCKAQERGDAEQDI